MADRGENKLTQLKVKNAPAGKLFDGGGLTLVKDGETGRWVYRYSHLGKRREMGLGSWPILSIADARKARSRWRDVLAAGRDPIDVRKQEQAAEVAERDKEDPTLADLTMMVFEARKSTLRGGGARGRWLSPLERHILPKLGKRRVSGISQDDWKDAFKPIWHTKWPTAEKAFQRVRIVLTEGQFLGFPCDPIDLERAKRLLGQVNHVVVPTPATPWQEIPDLYEKLPDTTGGDCLRFMILTLVRLDGCTGLHTSEIDGDIWTVPADRVKGSENKVKPFRVPLSQVAMDLVEGRAQFFPDLIFPGDTGRPISSRAVEIVLDKLQEAGRPHGFRTSFKTWAQDTDPCPWDVSEAVLDHKVGGKVERAYARSDLLDRRRPVMDAWARYVTGAESADVIPIRR